MASSVNASPPSSSSDPLATSRSLLERARHRDGPAWEQLVELYAPLVYFWCRHGHIAEQDIPDVVQDVFRSVVVGIDSFRKDQPGGTFRGWLRTVARSKISDYFRRQRHTAAAAGGTQAQHRMEQIAAEPLLDEDKEQAAEQALFFRGLEAIRGQFEPKTWDAFWRVVVEEQAVADVAQALSMQSGTVRVAKCRVLQRLRQQLGDLQ